MWGRTNAVRDCSTAARAGPASMGVEEAVQGARCPSAAPLPYGTRCVVRKVLVLVIHACI